MKNHQTVNKPLGNFKGTSDADKGKRTDAELMNIVFLIRLDNMALFNILMNHPKNIDQGNYTRARIKDHEQ